MYWGHRMRLRKEFDLLLEKVSRLEAQVRQHICEHDFAFICYFADSKKGEAYYKCRKCGLEKGKTLVQFKQQDNQGND